MANFSWLQDIQKVGDERERLRQAREKLLEVQDAGLSHPAFDTEKASHQAWSEDVLGLREIISELAPRYDVPPKKNLGYVPFEPDPEFDEARRVGRMGNSGWFKR